jgi:ferredoxin-NADP reductase
MCDSLAVEIVRVRQENPEVTTLYFARPFDFMAGQYITVFIEGSQVREGKAYSISSRPHEELMSITIKDVGGEFSSYLCSRQVGDKLQISPAWAFFNLRIGQSGAAIQVAQAA